jgi:D-glycero-alpha-D-manno-heptose-7-phosphate kinase
MIRVGYTQTELVRSVDELEHELVREALRKVGIDRRIEIATMGDIPSAGTGMGSSSAVTVGLLNGLYQFLGDPKEKATLARQACEVEIDALRKPIGVQDQYIAAYGGQRFMTFQRDGHVKVESLRMSDRDRRRLDENLLLFYTNITRKAESVLREQVASIADRGEALRSMKGLAVAARLALESGELDEFGMILGRSWEIKKQFATSVSNGKINEMYELALRAGALGGKLTGAGGGGFLLLYCPRERQEAVRSALRDYPELPFDFEPDGTKVIFNYPRQSSWCS